MARFVPNRNAVSQLERSIDYVRALHSVAEAAAEEAKRIARTEAYESGDYHDSIGPTRIRNEVYLRATDFKAGWIELGKANFKLVAPLRRGSRAVGLDLKESSK
jgi:hypothetical protein